MNQRKFACDFYSVWAQGTALYVKWSTDHGISYPELSVLYALLEKGPVTQKAISALYGLPKQTVNNCIRCMQKQGYIRLKTGQHDKREKLVVLTEEGDKYAQSTLAPLFKIEEYVCRNIDSEKFLQAIETRDLFNTLFEKEMERSLSQFKDTP